MQFLLDFNIQDLVERTEGAGNCVIKAVPPTPVRDGNSQVCLQFGQPQQQPAACCLFVCLSGVMLETQVSTEWRAPDIQQDAAAKRAKAKARAKFKAKAKAKLRAKAKAWAGAQAV